MLVRAALAVRAREHPHRHHDRQDSKGHGGDRRNAAKLHEEGGDEKRADEKGAAREQEQAGVCGRECEDGHGKGRDEIRAAEQCGAGDEADDEGEGEILRPERAEVEQTLALGPHLLAKKCQQRRAADHRQPQDARFLEPVPPAALAEDVGEAERAPSR